MGGLSAGGVVYEDLLVGADGPEDIRILPHRFRFSQEQVSSVIQRDVKDREQVFLKNRLEIDQQIPAADQIQPAEGRILKYIVLCEHNHRPDIVIHHIL